MIAEPAFIIVTTRILLAKKFIQFAPKLLNLFF